MAAPQGTRLLCLHGVFGSARSWTALSKAFSGRVSLQRRAMAVDLRNHGDAPWMATMTYGDMASDVAHEVRQSKGKVDVIGHSMGGRVAMQLAVDYPELVRKVVVLDILPVKYSARKTGMLADYGRAMLAVDMMQVKTPEDALRQLALHIKERHVAEFIVRDNMVIRNGHAQWRSNVPVIMNALPSLLDAELPPPSATARSDVPVLVLAGKRSNFVRTDQQNVLQALFFSSHVEWLDTGHWVQAEQPTAVIERTAKFLDDT